MTDGTPPNWSFKHRDIVILQELAADPQVTSRELADILETKYDIDVSHVTVSETIRKMREANVFNEAIIPNESYYNFALFEYKFNTENFADGWRDAMEYIRDDEHTLFFSITNGEYQWTSVMMFGSNEAEARWIHELYKRHGAVIENVRNSAMHNVLKFGADPELFRALEHFE
ncbi:helix-turn-helix domain-containing protein [Natronobeatus ordinarius]|uniref:helix-turn-helix domain-containing protein n=1 Tax=Natronobeatus ordinarius TaxID=2963433 RepID=UPI0020CC629D|nr:helix-turn-helix domain-containing protein [Natronobeatus ordinarius]